MHPQNRKTVGGTKYTAAWRLFVINYRHNTTHLRWGQWCEGMEAINKENGVSFEIHTLTCLQPKTRPPALLTRVPVDEYLKTRHVGSTQYVWGNCLILGTQVLQW